MKQKMISLCLVLLLWTGISETKAQSVIVKQFDGTENTELLTTVRNLSFSGSDLVLTFTSGSTDIYSLSTVRKIYFDTNISVNENTELSGNSLHIFPNPAGNSITVQSVSNKVSIVNIYRTDGSLVISQVVSTESQTLDISQLSSGLYLLTMNGQSAKFIKL